MIYARTTRKFSEFSLKLSCPHGSTLIAVSSAKTLEEKRINQAIRNHENTLCATVCAVLFNPSQVYWRLGCGFHFTICLLLPLLGISSPATAWSAVYVLCTMDPVEDGTDVFGSGTGALVHSSGTPADQQDSFERMRLAPETL